MTRPDRSTRGLIAAVAVGAALLIGGAASAGCLPAAAGAPAPTPMTGRPWEQAEEMMSAISADIGRQGPHAIAGHEREMVATLAAMPTPFDPIQERDGKVYILANDNAGLSIMSQIVRAAQQAQGGTACEIVPVRNPYPDVTLLLGYYYNDVGRPAEALQVLKIGLAQSPHQSHIISETGAAYVSLKDFLAALDTYSGGIALADIAPTDRARLYRGRGMALTELNRLDEAEKAYKDSLALDPDNPTALNELTYIARLKSGARPTAVELTTPPPRPAQ